MRAPVRVRRDGSGSDGGAEGEDGPAREHKEHKHKRKHKHRHGSKDGERAEGGQAAAEGGPLSGQASVAGAAAPVWNL